MLFPNGDTVLYAWIELGERALAEELQVVLAEA